MISRKKVDCKGSVGEEWREAALDSSEILYCEAVVAFGKVLGVLDYREAVDIQHPGASCPGYVLTGATLSCLQR